MPEWIDPPPPENIGDMYAAYGYCGTLVSYGVAYRNHAMGDHSGRWIWWLQMDDGDCYPWSDSVVPNGIADRWGLVWRNQLPPRVEARNAKP